MKQINSLFENTHIYDDNKIDNILSHYRDSHIIVFPVVNDGYVLNTFIEHLSENYLLNYFLDNKIMIFDKNIFLLNLYSSIVHHKEDLLSSLCFIEKTYNDSNNKLELYDLFMSYLNCRCEFNNMTSIYKYYKNQNDCKDISIASIDAEARFYDMCSRASIQSDITDSMLNVSHEIKNISSSIKNAVITKNDLKKFVIEGGYDVYKNMKSYDNYDMSYIDSISPYKKVLDASLYLAAYYLSCNLSHKNETIFDVLESWKYQKQKPDIKLLFNNIERLDFTNVYETIEHLYTCMKDLNIEVYCFDTKKYFTIYKSSKMYNPNSLSVFMYINCYDNFGKYDYEFSNIVVPRLIGGSTRNFLY